jgi:predicted alpha/beta hydrolase
MMRNETLVSPRGARWFWPASGAVFLGFPIGGAAATALVGPIETVGAAAVAGAVAGGVIGAAQWLVLRRRLALSALWGVRDHGRHGPRHGARPRLLLTQLLL